MPPATVTLWEGHLEPDRVLADRLQACLADDERARALRFHRPLDRERYVAGRGTLRHILAHHLDLPPRSLRFGYAADGKPYLSDYPELRFNLAHAGERFLVAVSRDGPLGVDLEPIPEDRVVTGIADRVLAGPEAAMLEALDASARSGWFATVWARKEACIKADGRGLGMDLTRLDVSTAPPRVLVWQQRPAGWRVSPRWTVRSIPADPGYAAALAVEGDEWQVERVRWPGPVRLAG